MKALLGKSNNSLRKAIRRGEIELPPPFAGQNSSRRTIDRKLCGNDTKVEAFLKRVIWRLIIGDAAYDLIEVALIPAIRRGKPRGRRSASFQKLAEGQEDRQVS